MTQEEKDLLLKDLCARLPYGVICKWEIDGFSNVGELTDVCHQKSNAGFQYWDGYLNFDGEDIPIEGIKPYLLPMSSMTEDEKQEMHRLLSPTGTATYQNTGIATPVSHFGDFIPYEYMARVLNWLNAHHFDYRGLIEKGLALEAPKDMYKS